MSLFLMLLVSFKKNPFTENTFRDKPSGLCDVEKDRSQPNRCLLLTSPKKMYEGLILTGTKHDGKLKVSFGFCEAFIHSSSALNDQRLQKYSLPFLVCIFPPHQTPAEPSINSFPTPSPHHLSHGFTVSIYMLISADEDVSFPYVKRALG
jgi:hypothetical protein